MFTNEYKYGDREDEPLFGVIDNKDGTITVNVYTRNKAVRRDISSRRNSPESFLGFAEFSGLNPRAKYHLAKLVRDYKGHFRTNSAKILMK